MRRFHGPFAENVIAGMIIVAVAAIIFGVHWLQQWWAGS